MRVPFQFPAAASKYCLVLALLLPVPFLGAQINAASNSKPKVKLVPRPLPGTGSSSSSASQAGPSGADIDNTQAAARAKVPLFRPASVTVPAGSRVDASASSAPQTAGQDPDRARIVLIRRRGTFEVPASAAPQVPALVNEIPSRSASTDPAMPAALAPGKIRVIPKDMIKIGTPAPHP